MLARCIVNLVNESGYSFTALKGENITNVEHLQEFGFASKMPSGEEANGISIFYGGDRGNASLLVLEIPKFKPDLADGESAIFNAFGAMVKLMADSSVVISGDKATETIVLNGNTNEGLVKIVELTTAINELVTTYNAHTHTYFNGSVFTESGAPSAPNQQVPLVKTDYENEKVVH